MWSTLFHRSALPVGEVQRPTWSARTSPDADEPLLPFQDVPEHGLRRPDRPAEGIYLEDEPEPPDNAVASTGVLSKVIIGGGIAALPLTHALLGWPLATLFLLLSAYVTWASIAVITRVCVREGIMSYPATVQKLYGPAAGLILELAILSFCFGMMLVYLVVTGDMLVGNGVFRGLLCRWVGSKPGLSWCCSRPLVVGIVTLSVFIPLVSFRRMQSMRLISWIGMGMVGAWGGCTAILVAAAVAQGALYRLYLLPDLKLLGPGALHIFTNVCACFCLLTTANSCQPQSVFIAAELRPFSVARMRKVAAAALGLCTALYLGVSLGTASLFGEAVQPDVLHNYTIEAITPLVGDVGAIIVYAITRLAFLSAVMTLFPLTMWPMRDSLLRLIFGQNYAFRGLASFYLVTYGITAAAFALSLVTRSIWGPLQIIGATSGGLIGFVFPGLLAWHTPLETLGVPSRGDLQMDATWVFLGLNAAKWGGIGFIALGLLQCVAGIAAQVFGGGSGGPDDIRRLQLPFQVGARGIFL